MTAFGTVSLNLAEVIDDDAGSGIKSELEG